MNPIQKYPHIIELSACILNMFVLMFLCFFDSFRNMFNTKTIKVNNFIIFCIQSNPMCGYICISSRFITYAPFFIVLGKLSLLYTPLKRLFLKKYSFISKFVKGCGRIRYFFKNSFTCSYSSFS